MLCRQGNVAVFCVVAIAIGAGSYGAAMGWWRDPLQALYTGIKLPLVILLTALGNGLLNGMLAPLLGLNVTFRQSLAVVLMSFALAAIVLGALSPVALFIVWNTRRWQREQRRHRRNTGSCNWHWRCSWRWPA